MLSPNEFAVGKVSVAKPLSLILPTNKYEETILVGWHKEAVTAVFLSGQHKSQFFECEGNEHWGGLIIPNVQIEVDERSCFGTCAADVTPLTVTRTDTRLVLNARNDRNFGRLLQVDLFNDLMPTGEPQAVFTNWQVVLGGGQNKRTM